ncbi:hypothetical protein PAXRUDRAFT_149584 [Paxillus rubicundulus Ve08.2h10]|uniref:Uncharacterized protein n=1 Tax=Paxillus rubicundulus Ve08.2h10 TaxID=930991 RepID=A0A0D0D4F4_9AGAM|nr:hypothetical protein PAXRUDRAFT_149584 [Paxillus rubicundulus Ve08.2h10]
MCYRQLQCIEFACGHKEPFTESKVDCNLRECRYSSVHVRPCIACSTTCLQMLGRAQPTVAQRKESLCRHCQQA